ncbi:MAG: peptidylprolyl isomerase [Candidatus Eisenbacteria bacterium]|nr:peptidylprolyl isomerase [Candidatus Eisenbacteria bacterium]
MRPTERSRTAIVVLLILSAGAVPGDGAPAPARNETAPAIAIVGSRRVPRGEFEQRVTLAEAAVRQRNGSDLPEDLRVVFRRQVLESMIRFELLVLEAQRLGIAATIEEADEQLKKDPYFNPGGKFDPGKFAAVKVATPPAYQSSVQGIRLRIAAQKLEAKMEQEVMPPEAALKDAATRQIAHISLDYLALDAADFKGAYPEPRERDILEFYTAHVDDFRRGARARISLVFIDQPSLSDSLRSFAGETRAWDARMRQRADSALAVIRAGASFDEVGAALGGVHPHVTVGPDNFPGYWLGTREMGAAVFQLKASGVLSQPVPTNPGYLLVRLESLTPAHIAPLAEVSPEIRGRLRETANQHRDDREIEALYAQVADSLRAPAVRVRYATADTLAMDPGEPAEADLDRFYRGHLADYSSFDPQSGVIRSLPLADVRGDVGMRWRHERRIEMARALAEGLARSWSAGKRDAELERSATRMRDIGPLPVGADVDTGRVGSAITDSISNHGATRHWAMAAYRSGYFVYHVYETIPSYKPTLEQARNALRERLQRRQEQSDLLAARALFDRDPPRWARGNTIHLSRFFVPPLDRIAVPLTRTEVERYHVNHMDLYSAPEMVEARHILISPTGPGPGADRIAHQRADSLLRAIRAGEDFSSVARRVTDDPATRGNGGDLGEFARGVMLPEFESAAFSLKPGQISEPVRTSVGWHLIRCVNHVPIYAQPLAWIYGNVGFDAAGEKADSIASHRADSLARNVHTPAEARAAARKLGLFVESNTHVSGDRHLAPDIKPYLIALEDVKPGHLLPGARPVKGQGYVITWVDSITAPQAPGWESVRSRVLETYRLGAPARALEAKTAELDSMMASGWSFDSLGTLWGGLAHVPDALSGAGIRELSGSREVLDSLAWGAAGGPPLSTGAVSGWQTLPRERVRLRISERKMPDVAMLAQRIEIDRRAAADRGLKPRFEELRRRYGVRILDPKLEEVSLPAPPPAPPGLP